MSIEQQSASGQRAERFVSNAAWGWIGSAAGLLAGLLLSPYLIHKLGAEAYGIWTLSFALVEYCGFLDLGFRSATVKYVAHYHALSDSDGVSRVINTVLLYSGLISVAIVAIAIPASASLRSFFRVSADFEHSFRILIVLISVSWCIGFVLGVFGACLEAIQRFDLYNKATVISTVTRAAGTGILLFMGYGLIAISVWTVITQCFGYVLYFVSFRRAVSSFRISFALASLRTLRMMASFGVHTFVGNMSMLLLNQSPPILIGHFLPAAFVGYYQLPMKLIQYTSDGVARIGIVTNANAAELSARGESPSMTELAVYSNRYALMLFMPLALIFWIFGDRIFSLWVPSIARFSAPLLPILLTGCVIAVVAQFSSGMLLQGMGRHQWYSRGVLLEAITVCALLVLVIPRYGIKGAAWAVALCMVADRGIFAPWLASRELRFSFAHFVHSIYTWPFVVAIPVAILAMLLRITVLPGSSWPQLFIAGVVVAVSYFGLAFFVCIPANHRAQLADLALRSMPLRRPA